MTLVYDGYTNSSGMLTITGLEIGWHTINISKNSYMDNTVTDYIHFPDDVDIVTAYLTPYPPGSGYIDVTVRESVSTFLMESTYVECFNQSTLALVDSGYTDINGFYRITGLYIGDHIVNVSYPGYIRQSKPDYIHFNGDDDALPFYLVAYPPSSGIIKVTVNNSVTSLPVENVFVDCWDKTIGYSETYDYTDSQGKGILDALMIGEKKVNVSKNGYYVQEQDVDIDYNGEVEKIHFNLVPYPPYSGYIELQVNDSNTMLPINNSYVECFNKSSMEFLKSGYTDNSGFYNITGLAEGEYVVNVSNNGYVSQFKLGYINWSGAFDYLNFELVPNLPNSGYIEVNVHDADSLLPLENAFVEWYYSNGTYIGSFSTAVDGYYNISGLAIGSYIVNISRPSYFSQSKVGDINWNGDHTEIDFLLQASSIVLISPTSSDDWEAGTSHSINWTVIGSISTLKIELYKSDALELVIEPSISNDGGYEWLIPTNSEESDLYQIKVSDPSNPSIYDFSDYFQINQPPSETPSPSVHSFNVLIILGIIGLLSMIIASKKLRKLKFT